MPMRRERTQSVHKRLHFRRRIPAVAVLVVLILALLIGAQRDLANDSNHDRVARYRDGIVLLAFRDGTQPAQQKAILSSLGAREIKRIGVGVHVVSVKPGQVLAAIHSLKALEAVRYAEPDYLQSLSASGLPNDTFVGSQWAVQNTGQSVNGTLGTSGADERSLEAWGITTGTNSVVIAELDTGVQYSHPDLFTNMWNNPGGIGGCSAGTHGYNVLSSTCDPMDDDTEYGGHGTHVAGIMGAVGNNAAGTAGVNWTTSIMAIKWVNSSGTGATSDLITGMDWVVSAKQAGINIRVANDSQTWPGTAFSQALSDEIDLLGSNDILFVTASGNTAQDNDVVPRYPCSYQRPTMICAAASDQSDNLWSSANYGPNSVQLAAPGVNIYSTLRVSNYGYISGGSMASPQVAGTAALILSLGYQSVGNLRNMILNNVDVLSSLAGLVGTSGRLNVCKAVPGCSTAVAAQPAISMPPVVTSLPVQGGLLGASTGAWTGIPSAYTYQWSRCDQNGLNCSPILGATGQTYALLAPADTLATLAVTVTASNTIGSSAAQSSASGVVATAISSAAINSSIASGATLSGSANWTVTPARSEQFVQFYIDGVLTETDSASPYIFTTGSSGLLDTTALSNGPHVLGVRALYTDNRTYDFYGETVTVSNPPQNTALPLISGTILFGQALSTTNGIWNPNAVPTSYSNQWEHCDSNGLNCSTITGATASTYILSGIDSNFTIRSMVTASNSAGPTISVSAQTTFVPPASSVSISTTSLPNGTQNVVYSATLAASGGTLPYTWSITSGSLPTGLTLTPSTGAISGTPSGTGTSNFTVQVADANSLTATKPLTLTVVAPPTVTTTSLPNGTQNAAYSATLAATGGTLPYTWSITSRTLPAGLTLTASTGAISGTPSGTGTSSFTVQVADANSLTGDKIAHSDGGGAAGRYDRVLDERHTECSLQRDAGCHRRHPALHLVDHLRVSANRIDAHCEHRRDLRHAERHWNQQLYRAGGRCQFGDGCKATHSDCGGAADRYHDFVAERDAECGLQRDAGSHRRHPALHLVHHFRVSANRIDAHSEHRSDLRHAERHRNQQLYRAGCRRQFADRYQIAQPHDKHLERRRDRAGTGKRCPGIGCGVGVGCLSCSQHGGQLDPRVRAYVHNYADRYPEGQCRQHLHPSRGTGPNL
jgi:subtilisin family serine protease